MKLNSMVCAMWFLKVTSEDSLGMALNSTVGVVFSEELFVFPSEQDITNKAEKMIRMQRIETIFMLQI